MTPRISRASSEIAVDPPHDTLIAAFEAAARTGAPFVTFHAGKESVAKTSAQALERALLWAKLLASRGVSKGDRIPILLPSGHTFVEALLGTMLLGAVPVPLAGPMTFGSVDRFLVNLATIAVDCGARATITYGRIREAVGRDATLASSLGELIGEEGLEGVQATSLRLPSMSASDTAFIQYTSGTTGKPKGVVVSHRAIVANAFAIARGAAMTSADVGVSWLPMFHDMGLIGVLLTSICHPYPLHVMSPEHFVMNPRRWLDLIGRVGGTIAAAPNFAYDMCVARGGEAEGLDLHTWRRALNGAEPVHATTVARFHEKFAPSGLGAHVTMPVYGMAEATLAVAFPAVGAELERLMVDRTALEEEGRVLPQADGQAAISVGRPVAGVQIEVIGDGGAAVPERTVGEIRVSGPSLMDGYFQNDEASAAVLSGGWLRTGDIGFMDRGTLFVTGRAKELIIKSGRNLYPYDVERIAGNVAGVRQGGVAAFGRTNEKTGTEDLVVIAETAHADATRREEIAKAVRAELLEVLGVKPDDIRLCGVGKVPRTTSGKIQRRECARLVASGELG
jgi:acyl-CoA synthetase (AMP-forming)/AMP-acid ligase II